MGSIYPLKPLRPKTFDGVEEIHSNVDSKSISSSDPPMEEWSSFNLEMPCTCKDKHVKHSGLVDICDTYVVHSDSTVNAHPYIMYRAVEDPGVKEALLGPVVKTQYDADGQLLYLELCEKADMAPVRIFYRSLLKDVINLKYYCVNPNGVVFMCEALKENTKVERLDLTSSFLNNDACYHLGRLLAESDTLKKLILSQCRIRVLGLLRLIDPLNSTRLEILDLSKNQLEDTGVQILCEKMIKGLKIKQLNLKYNGIGPLGAQALINYFMWNKTTVTHLNLAWNGFVTPRTLKLLVIVLSDSKVLKFLDLSWNAIAGESYLANLLQAPSLTTLKLNNNQLSKDAIKAITDKYHKAKKLQVLNLAYNPLEPKEAYELLQKLRSKTVKLKHLILDGIDVTQEFAEKKEEILSLSHRKQTVITHGKVMQTETLKTADYRETIVKRCFVLGNTGPRAERFDIAQYFLEKRLESPILIHKQMLRDMKTLGRNVKQWESVVEELAKIFPGPYINKNTRAIDLERLADYVQRMWPNAKPSPMHPVIPGRSSGINGNNGKSSKMGNNVQKRSKNASKLAGTKKIKGKYKRKSNESFNISNRCDYNA